MLVSKPRADRPRKVNEGLENVPLLLVTDATAKMLRKFGLATLPTANLLLKPHRFHIARLSSNVLPEQPPRSPARYCNSI